MSSVYLKRNWFVCAVVWLCVAHAAESARAQEPELVTDNADQMVVTGTRRSSRTVVDSNVPIDVVRASDLKSAQQSLSRYFDPQSKAVQIAKERIAQIQAQLQSSELPRLDETLTALSTAAGAAGK